MKKLNNKKVCFQCCKLIKKCVQNVFLESDSLSEELITFLEIWKYF